jgi:uncharacterized protein (DUF1499 family)
VPAFAFLGRMLGAPGRPAFTALPGRAEARALVDAGPADNVAVTDPAAPTPWLRPTVLPQPLDQAHARVLGAIGLLRGWSLAGDSPDVVWATRTTPMLGFVDDVIILLTPRGPGTVVEARSASRVGQGDLGRNRSTLRELADVLSRWT